MAFLAALLATAHAGENRANGNYREGTPRNLRAFATDQMDGCLKKVDEIVNRKEEKLKLHEELWDQQWEYDLTNWATWMNQLEESYKEKAGLLAETQAWRATQEAFFNQVRADGHRILYWRGKLRVDTIFLKNDTDDYKDRVEHLFRDLDDVEEALDDAAKVVGDKDVSVADLDKHIQSLDVMFRAAQAVGDNLQMTVDSVEKHHGLKAPKLPKDVEAILARWEAPKETYPDIMQRWTSYLTAWAKLQRKDWTAFGKARKDFDEAYGPVVSGKVCDGRKRFKGVKYSDYGNVVDAMRTNVRAWRLKMRRRDTDISVLRKALEEEKRISAEEKKQYKALFEPYSASKERELRLASARAAGGVSGVRDAQLKAARAKPGSEEEKKYRKLADDIENFRHPDQIAADKALADFKKGEAEAIRKARDLMDKRKRRRAKLGLTEDFD